MKYTVPILLGLRIRIKICIGNRGNSVEGINLFPLSPSLTSQKKKIGQNCKPDVFDLASVHGACLAEKNASIFLKKNAVYDARTLALAIPGRGAVGFYLEFSSCSDSPNAESNY